MFPTFSLLAIKHKPLQWPVFFLTVIFLLLWFLSGLCLHSPSINNSTYKEGVLYMELEQPPSMGVLISPCVCVGAAWGESGGKGCSWGGAGGKQHKSLHLTPFKCKLWWNMLVTEGRLRLIRYEALKRLPNQTSRYFSFFFFCILLSPHLISDICSDGCYQGVSKWSCPDQEWEYEIQKETSAYQRYSSTGRTSRVSFQR